MKILVFLVAIILCNISFAQEVVNLKDLEATKEYDNILVDTLAFDFHMKKIYRSVPGYATRLFNPFALPWSETEPGPSRNRKRQQMEKEPVRNWNRAPGSACPSLCPPPWSSC